MATTVNRMQRFDKNTLSTLFERAGESNIEPNQDFFSDEKNILLVAYTDGDLSGFLWAYVLARPDKSTPKILLYSIDTFDPFKRRGVGTLLIRHLKEIARAHHCYEMFVPTSSNNLPAVGLYRKTGGISLTDDAVSFTYDREALNT